MGKSDLPQPTFIVPPIPKPPKPPKIGAPLKLYPTKKKKGKGKKKPYGAGWFVREWPITSPKELWKWIK